MNDLPPEPLQDDPGEEEQGRRLGQRQEQGRRLGQREGLHRIREENSESDMSIKQRQDEEGECLEERDREEEKIQSDR